MNGFEKFVVGFVLLVVVLGMLGTPVTAPADL